MELKLKQRLTVLNASSQGFTMIELMVAMTIALVVLGAMYISYRSQQKSYMAQEEVAVMQQNLRAAMFHLQREIRMAGCDPLEIGNVGILTANATSINFTEDVAGAGPDGTISASENITYSLSGTTLVRNAGAGNQAVAENIDAIDFVYLRSDQTPINNAGTPNVAPANLPQIRFVEITLVVRAGRPLRGIPNNTVFVNQQGTQIYGPAGDNFSRKQLTAVARCRNLGI